MLLRHIEVVKAETSRITKEGQVLAKAKSQPSFETLVRKLSDIVRGEGRLRGGELHPVNEVAPLHQEVREVRLYVRGLVLRNSLEGVGILRLEIVSMLMDRVGVPEVVQGRQTHRATPSSDEAPAIKGMIVHTHRREEGILP